MSKTDEWRLKQMEWRGYTVKALEDMNNELKEIKHELKDTNKKIDRLNNALGRVQIKVAGIGATVAILVSIILHIMW